MMSEILRCGDWRTGGVCGRYSRAVARCWWGSRLAGITDDIMACSGVHVSILASQLNATSSKVKKNIAETVKSHCVAFNHCLSRCTTVPLTSKVALESSQPNEDRIPLMVNVITSRTPECCVNIGTTTDRPTSNIDRVAMRLSSAAVPRVNQK